VLFPYNHGTHPLFQFITGSSQGGSENLTETLTNSPGARQPVRRSVSYQLMAQLIGLASSLAALPILSRYLGLAGFGVYVTVSAFVSLMTTFTDLGVGATAVREVSSGRLKDGPTSTTAAILRCANAVVVITIGVGIAIAQGQSRDVVIGLILSTISIVATCASSAGGTTIFQIKGRFGWTVVNAAVQAPIWIISVLVIVAAHLSVLYVFVALGFASVVGTIISLTTARRLLDHPPAFDLSIARLLLRQGAPLGVAAMLAATYYRVDTVILSSIAGTVAVGLYGASYRFIDQVRQVASFVGVAYHPIFSRESQNEATFRAELGRLVRLASLFGATASIGLFAGAELATRIMFGARFVGASGLLRILSLAVLPMFLNNSIPYSMIARRKQVIYVPINAAALIFNVSGNYLLIPHFGSVASAVLTDLTELLVLMLSLTAMRRAFGFLPSLRSFFGAGAALLVAGGAYLVAVQLNYFLAAAGSLAVYVALLLIFRVVDVQTIKGLSERAMKSVGKWRARQQTGEASMWLFSRRRRL
jgi:O-antigen/teichoic acid export membrane protein